MSQGSTVSQLSSSQPTDGEPPSAAPTSKWKIWSRGINKGGDWYCTHRFEDGTQAYHYVHKSGTIYMMHRDGSATFCPTEGRYISCADHDENSSIPAPTREEIIKEANEVKEEHRQYLASPIKYWKGFDYSHDDTNCDCGDRYSTVDDDYPSWEDGYGDELDYGLDYDPYYELHFEEEDPNSEDDEENEEGDYTDDDRSFSSPDEHEPTIKQEDNKTTARMADIKQEIKEETHHELVSGHLTVLKVEQEGTPGFTSTPDPVASGSAVTASGTGDQAPRDPEVGPAVQTEGKRILRSHRSKPY